MILSVGVVPVRKVNNEWEFLILRCFKYWDFPKGELEKGEEAFAAAIREVEEETTLVNLAFKWGEVFYETEAYSTGKVARYYLAEVKNDSPIKLLPNPENGIVEHHEYRWVNLEEGLKLTNPRIQKVLKWARTQL